MSNDNRADSPATALAGATAHETAADGTLPVAGELAPVEGLGAYPLIRQIVKDWLATHGYEGLFMAGECGCELSDLFPGFDCPSDKSCRAGYKIPCNPDTCELGGGCEWHIGLKGGQS